MEKTTLDIVMRENDFVIYKNDNPLLTPLGNEIAHTNARLLRHIVTQEILGFSDRISNLNLLSVLIDSKNRNQKIEIQEINSDPLISNSQNVSWLNSSFLLGENSGLLDFIFLNSSSLHSALNNFKVKKGKTRSVTEFLQQCINDMTQEQMAVLDILKSEYASGVMLHYLLIKNLLSATEFAAGVIIFQLKSNNQKFAGLKEDKAQNLIVSVHKKITDDAFLALDFLALCKNENQISVIEEIIQQGENSTTEFKSTLRWDIRQSKKNPAIEHAVLKTICAFLNSEGGNLLIGVTDDGSIEGVETDKLDNDDRFLLHLWGLIKTCLGQEVIEWVKTSLQKFGDKTVCRVNCSKGVKPVFLRQKGFNESFYVRVGPSSSSLEIRSALKYIEQHF